jgi:hypothetical protein
MNKAELPPDTSASPLCPLYAASHPFMDLSGILQRTSSSRHSGSATLVVDLDGDGDKDVLLTDISSARLLYIENCGTPDSAYACAQDTLFPSYDVPAQLSSPMGAAYYFDADNDGNKDLIYANFWGTGDDYDNSYFYKNMTNNTTNRFAFQNKRFLGNTMIDVGTSAHPVLYDFDGDGLKDMFIGDDYYSKNYVSKIAYYHNSGTATNPVFNLVTDDFGNLSALSGIAAIYPTFGDLDGDGDPDMLCGENGGGLLYFENVNGTMVFITANYQSIGVGSTAAPQLVDVDRDGKLDLVIGKRNGQLSYFRNTSTTNSPIFTLVTNNFGGVTLDVGFFSAPCLFEHNGTYEMLVGSQSGWLYHYTNIDGNLSGTFTLADSTFQNIYQPTRACPTVADIDGDGKYDLIVGNQEGGVTLYTQNALLNAIHEETAGGSYFTLYPNPASSSLQLLLGQTPSSGRIEIQIFDVLGQQVMNQRSILTNVGIDISELTPGLYLCKVVDGNRSFSQTFIKE